MAYYVYITTNPAKQILYIGVTNDLPRRLGQHHKNRGSSETFASRYFCYNVLYYEQFADIKAAISREKELKGWTRVKKDSLIDTLNSERKFLLV